MAASKYAKELTQELIKRAGFGDDLAIDRLNKLAAAQKAELAKRAAAGDGLAPIAVGAGALAQSDDSDAGPLTAGARRIIDSRFSSPLGGGNPRKGLTDAVETMQTGITPRDMDKGGDYNLYDFEGSPYILTQSDRSAAGGVINSVKGRDIDEVDLRGGRDFMFDSPSEGQVWASDPNVVNSLQKRAKALKAEFGKDPILLPYSMAPTGIDFATMPLDTMVNYARTAMSKANIKKLDSKIKAVIPEWKGVADPSSNAIFREVKGPKRKAVANIFDKDFRDVNGGMSISEARAATTSADQYIVPEGNIKNIGRIDTSRDLITDSGHPTYIGGLPGEGVGTFANELNVRPFMAQNGRNLSGGPSDIRALSMNHGLSEGIVDSALLKSIFGSLPAISVGALIAAGLTPEQAQAAYQSQAYQESDEGINDNWVNPALMGGNEPAQRDYSNKPIPEAVRQLIQASESANKPQFGYAPNDSVKYGQQQFMEIEETPWAENSANFIDKWTQTPIGSPLEGTSNYLRNLGRKKSALSRAADSIGLGLDFF